MGLRVLELPEEMGELGVEVVAFAEHGVAAIERSASSNARSCSRVITASRRPSIDPKIE